MNSEEILKKFGVAQQRANSENNMEAYKDFMSDLAAACVKQNEERNIVDETNSSIDYYNTNENFIKGGNDNIYNTYNYTNVVISDENMKTLVKYIFDINNYFEECAKIDEEKNKPIKYQFRNYSFRKNTIRSSIMITKDGKTYNFNNYDTFLNFCNSSNLKNISSIVIFSTVDFCVGRINELIRFDNKLNISIKPYKIDFTRKSNIHHDYIDKYESNIIKIFDTFKKVDSIF